MGKSISTKYGDFDDQAVTDYFQFLVKAGKIHAFKSFQHQDLDQYQQYTWVVTIKKRWEYVCTIVLFPSEECRNLDLAYELSRSCVIVTSREKPQRQILNKVKSRLLPVIFGAEAERHVEKVVNTELALEGGATIHCFPSSMNDDINGVDMNIYYRPNQRSDVIKMPLQIKFETVSKIKLQSHIDKFPHIPVLLYKKDSEYIRSEIVRLLNYHIAQSDTN